MMELGRRRREAALQTTPESPGTPRGRINMVSGSLILGLALSADLADYLIVGAIPIAGDVIDIGAGAVIWFWVVTKGLNRGRSPLLSWIPWMASGIELIPLIGDIPPSFTISVLIIMALNTEAGRKLARTISPV